MIIVSIVSLIVIWNSFAIILVINGVASVNVVAVPASKANTANKSINLPRKPSICLPKSGRHASENF